ncbi:hypothetical protein [Roseomonas sp. WA12]
MSHAATSSDQPVVFIHTNAKQRLGALVSAHSFRRNAREPGTFNVRLIEAEGSGPLRAAEGRSFIRDGHSRAWHMDDLQSFTPLRFAVPDAMGHRGVALVVDPDVFAVGDVGELFARDRAGKAIWCRARPGHNGAADYLASSVMLLDCALLPHWRFEPMLEDLFAGRLDYVELIELRRENREKIGLLDPVWNSFDTLTPETRLLHTTKRRTQPWKTGLPVDFTLRERGFGPIPASVVRPFLRFWTSHARYRPHPDPRQEALFFGLLAECLDEGSVTRAEVEEGIRERHVRADSLALVDRYRGQLPPRPAAAA